MFYETIVLHFYMTLCETHDGSHFLDKKKKQKNKGLSGHHDELLYDPIDLGDGEGRKCSC